MTSKTISRRTLIKAAAVGSLAAPMIWTGSRAFGAEQITVADVGGAPGRAIRKAFYDPFEKETGIKVINAAHETDPVTQFKLLVDTKSYLWDVCSVTPNDFATITKTGNYVELIGIKREEFPTVVPQMIRPDWIGFSIWSMMLAYRTDHFPGNGPKNWADFWDVAKFPGRRGMYKGPQGTLECALMAAGVPHDKLYPLDTDLAFKMMDKIKPHINVWWDTGAKNTQVLQSGEVDMTFTWGGRAFAAMDSGAPVKVVWNQTLYSSDGWAIPKGSPKADLGRKFIRFCLKPEQQAIFSSNIANAPTNTKAFDFISPEHAERLATSPSHIAGAYERDDLWWSKNRSQITERFDSWLLS
jgi:putative spermidine/putrescine transport system substrate-binding protein